MSPETEPNSPGRPTLLRLGLADLEACLALDQAALAGLWSREQWRQELQEPKRPCIGLWGQRRLIAMACGWLVVDELHITAVAVAPDCRRRGHGEQVLQGLLREALQRGARHATLEVSTANTAAAGLYARCGFATAGIRRGYYRNGDDALIQWARLQDMEGVRIAAHS